MSISFNLELIALCNKRNERIIENYKKTTDKRMEMYDELIESRNKGINAVRNEKQKLLEFDLKKKNLLENMATPPS